MKKVVTEAKLLLIGIPVAIWTLLPIYNLFLFSISTKEEAFAGQLWPDHPTLRNFEHRVPRAAPFPRATSGGRSGIRCSSRWRSACITLVVATTARVRDQPAEGARRPPGDELALFTYFIPAAFLAVPMYKAMGAYGLLNSQWALILAMMTIAAPYAIWVLKQASDKLPFELDEAARIDGASPLQLFRLVYLPLMTPSLVAVGTYALLLAWNEYLYAFLLLSSDQDVTLAVALGQFLSADDSPWELLMTTGLIYALPPAAIYYAFKRYMVGGLTAGA